MRQYERTTLSGIRYSVVRSARKTFSISIQPDGRVLVRAPQRAAFVSIDDVVQSKQRWIAQKQELVLRRAQAHPPKSLQSGEEFLFLGQKVMLALSERVGEITLIGSVLAFPRSQLDKGEALLKAWFRRQAKEVLAERVRLLAEQTGISYAAVGITDARHRWGSCTSRGRLNFTWRLVMAPMEVIDYVVVHELSHRLHLNHSRDFWACVAQIMPGYRDAERWLKDNSALLRLM